MMGSPPTEAGRNADEGPQHPVTLKPFWMGAKEVTWDEFDQFWHNRPIGQKEDVEPETPKNADAVTHPTAPYADETWRTAARAIPSSASPITRPCSIAAGCRSRPARPIGCRPRRSGNTPPAPAPRRPISSATIPRSSSDYAWDTDNSDGDSKAVGKKKPNPWGLHDIYGNVSEYCLDLYRQRLLLQNVADHADVAAGEHSRQPPLRPRGPRRLVGRRSRLSAAAPRGGVRQELDQARSATAAEHLVADQRRFRRLPRRAAGEEQDNLKGYRSQITLGSK